MKSPIFKRSASVVAALVDVKPEQARGDEETAPIAEVAHSLSILTTTGVPIKALKN